MFRSVHPPPVTQRAGTGPMPLLCFAVVEATVILARMSTLVSTAALIVVVSALWRASAGSVRTMSDVPLPGPVMFPIMILIAILITRPVAVFILAIGRPWFLLRIMPEVPPPHDAAVGGAGMAI